MLFCISISPVTAHVILRLAGAGEKTFVFLDNYIKLFQDAQFWNSLLFTMKYAVFVTPCLFILAFILALLINGAFKGVNLFRSLYFAPVVISMTCCSMVWLWIYQ